jgi:two-component system OmpR family sensor kinase
MSLRTRLIAVLVGVATAGLLLLAGITYAALRSFELKRVDQQAESARPLIEGQLEHGCNTSIDPGPGGGGRGMPPGNRPPPGTYGERRDAAGRAVGRGCFVGYNQTAPPAPVLPAMIAPGAHLTVRAQTGDLHYRVVSLPDRELGSIVVAVPLADVEQTLNRLLVVEPLVIAGVLLILGVVAALLVRIGLRPLDRMATTAGVIAGGELSRRVSPATARTEVGRLGLALNAMLERLEEAFARRQESEDRLRRFLSDASHELRTPLASIRGYAELFRMGAAREPDDVAKAMRRIEEEAARMGVLVEDLLALARLDELRDPVRRPVDVAEIARDTVDDARATAPERTIALDARDGALVLADAHQIRQVLANLLRNALVHTPAGTPVEVTVEPSGTDVRVEVRDHGPGLPTDDADALFGRFWRAEGGRERGKGGAGLGLAIVAGIVEAHHGRVHATNAEDGGARFSVLLPAAAPAPAITARPHLGRIAPPMREESTSEFRVDEERRDGVVVLRLAGDLDLASADEVSRRLDALCAAGDATVLDLDELAFMDSSGLRVVLRAAETASAGTWEFTITPGSDQVRRLFVAAGITERLPIMPRR